MNARSGDRERRFRASRTLIGAKRRQQWSGDPPLDAACSSYGLRLLLIKQRVRLWSVVDATVRPRTLRETRSARFHRSGTIHRLPRIIEAPRGLSSTVHDAVEARIPRRIDPSHPARSPPIMISPSGAPARLRVAHRRSFQRQPVRGSTVRVRPPGGAVDGAGDAPREPQDPRAAETDYRGNNDYLIARMITSSGLPPLFLDSCFMPRPMNSTSPRFHWVLALPSTVTDIASLSPSAITT